ncbi:coiled-coil domain-containing protein 174 [Anabrus simplex]|uniref:coiled-coil domain-containing protein 174 n=1 Tax=Anabrus simplex TaxID=316456 RepID=UPI0035A38708
MNTSKKIDVSKSSLVSLKAELSRKHEEVSKAKAAAGSGFIHPVPRPKKETVLTKKNRGVEQRDERDAEERKVEEDAHRKSRAVLEAKSRLYEQLYGASSTVNPDADSRYLVDFQRKAAESESRIAPDSSTDVEEQHDSDEYDTNVDPEDDWVDYTDCLGRTRRCLRRDMDLIKNRDAKLAKSLSKLPEGEAGETNFMLNDLRLQKLREKWEQQEEELRERNDIHYQNVLFDDTRSSRPCHNERVHRVPACLGNNGAQTFKIIDSPAPCEVRSVIRFLSARSLSGTDIHRQICEVYGANAMSEGKVHKWVRDFKDGRDNVTSMMRPPPVAHL